VSEYIKFKCEHTVVPAVLFDGFAELNACRQKLRRLEMIGVNANGIGFGNLSIRDGTTNSFYITASATGGISELTLAGYARVVAYDFARNWLRCEGSVIASSESLTHAAVYESEAKAGAVIHGHNLKLWATLLGHAPTTSKAIEYGTPEMAYEVRRLFKTTDVKSRKIFVMAGHEGGVVTLGKDLEEAFTVLERVIGNE
jgi:ribulose-5-phosphate 4-epimerase/fuculose-1-phosphate aldolase